MMFLATLSTVLASRLKTRVGQLVIKLPFMFANLIAKDPQLKQFDWFFLTLHINKGPEITKNDINVLNVVKVTQQTFTCSKSTIETLEKGAKYI